MKRYQAELNQGGTGDPTPTIIKNTLDGEPVASRNEAGEYQIYLSGAFPPDRTFVQISAMSSGLSLEAAPGLGDTVTYSVQKIDFDDQSYQGKDGHRVAISITVMDAE